MNRKLSMSLAAFAVVVAACTTGATTTTAATPTTTPPSVTTTTATTVSPPSSSTTTTSTTTMTPGGQGFSEEPAVYRVVDVARDDVLNIRSGPGIANDVVATYGHDYSGVLTTGNAWNTAAGSTWVEVTEAQFQGWVNKRFLEMVDQTRAPLGVYPCTVGSEDLGDMQSSWPAPDGVSNADHIFDVQHISAGGCARTVITLGTRFDWEALDSAVPADRVSGMVTAVDTGNPVPHVIIDTHDLFRALPGASGRFGAYVFRKTAGPQNEFGQHALAANVPTGPGTHNVFYLESPARIVIDHWFVPAGNSQPSWASGTGVVLIEPADVAPTPEALQNGTVFAGYSRGFEANLVAVVKEAESGRPVVAKWEPVFGGSAVTTDLYITTVNDWTEAWGQFAFRLDDLDPDEYILEMATDDAAGEANHQTLQFRFTITN